MLMCAHPEELLLCVEFGLLVEAEDEAEALVGELSSEDPQFLPKRRLQVE
jgi:hypothetical protein